MATSQFAQTTLRSIVGQHDLDQMLTEREKLNTEIQRVMDERTNAWGIKVCTVRATRSAFDPKLKDPQRSRKKPTDVLVDRRIGNLCTLLAKLALCPDRVAAVVSNKRIVEVLCFYEN